MEKGPIDKFLAPGWWLEECFRGESESESESSRTQLGRSVVPPFHFHELISLSYLLAFLQNRLPGSKSDGVELSLTALSQAFPTLSDSDAFVLKRLLYILPSIKVLDSSLAFGKPLVKHAEASSLGLFFKSDAIESSLLFGLRNYYDQDLTAQSKSSLMGCVPLSLSLLQKLDKRERKIMILFTKALSADRTVNGHLELNIEPHVAAGDIDRKSVIGFAEKLGHLGYLDPLENRGSLSEFVSSSGLESYLFRVGDQFPNPDMQLAISVFVESLCGKSSNDHFVGFFQNLANRSLYENELSGLKSIEILLKSEPSLASGFLVEGDRVVSIPHLFIEWSARNSPLHKNPLPAELQNSLFSDICYLAHEDVTGNFKKFCKIFRYDEHVKHYVKRMMEVQKRSKVSLVKKEEMNVKEIKTKSHDNTPSPVKSEYQEMAETKIPQNDDVKVTNRLNAISLADKELRKIKKLDESQYSILRRKYINSLSELDQKILKDIQERMRKDVFEQQIHNRIVKFMVKNPGLWTSVN